VSDEQNLVTITDLHFHRDEQPILNGISLAVRRGEVAAIIGPSGAGKTTLLDLLGGRLAPQRGYIIVDGLSVPDLARGDLFRLRKRLGMLFQSGALLSDLNVYENVAFPLREHSQLPEVVIRQLVLMKLQLVGLRSARQLMPDQLSGGMARRVALARAIVMDPMMVMYDEPFTGLDPVSKAVIVKLIRELNDTLGMTSIIVTHDVNEACQIADSVHLVMHGQLLASGTPQQLQKSTRAEVRQFMAGQVDGPLPFHYGGDSGYLADLLGES
jgi:phospholipid/cholesterol/gamma-HCH transport system ATP-binding protein